MRSESTEGKVPPARRPDEGFALLMVFLLAACVAIMLYTEVPRVAFEAERQRELLLVDRGQQFRRAIQVFYTDKTNNPTHRYPASIEELENFNNHRYLRRRYKDPMTGKDEWRLVHINGGVLTDSVTTKNNMTGNQSGSSAPAPPAYISSTSYMDGTGDNAGRGGGAARAMNRRASESQGPGAAGDSGPGSMTSPGGSPGMQGAPGGAPTTMPVGMTPPSGLPPGMQPGLPGQPGSNGPAATAQPQACNVYIGSCPTTPTTGQSAQVQPGSNPAMPGGMPGMPPGGMPPTGGAPGGSGTPAGFNTPGGAGGSNAQSAAAGIIQGLLTSPRPNGMPSNMPGSTVGGGIAGVASKYEADGIMVINDRTAINEWEYIFDVNKYRAPINPISGTPGTPLQGMQGGNTGTPIGSGPGSSPMGNQPTGTTPTGGGRGQ